MEPIKVSIEQGVEIATAIGVGAARKASMFMSHGINASKEYPKASFRLPGFIQLVDAPEDLNDGQVQLFGIDFREWVVSNGFRELLEGVESSLNFFCRIIIEAEKNKARKKRKSWQAVRHRFERLGVGPKFKYLDKHFGLGTGFEHYYESLTKARNCMTHRRGFVAERDFDDGEKFLTLLWLGVDAEIEEFDGTKHPISIDTVGPFDSTKFHPGGNAKLHIKFVDRKECFHIGDRIHLNPRHLQEICSMTSYVSLKLRQLTINYLLDLGFNIFGGVKEPDPQANFAMLVDEYAKRDELTDNQLL